MTYPPTLLLSPKIYTIFVSHNNLISLAINFMNWIFLIVGGLFEALFAFSLERLSESTGKTAILWFFSFLISVSISMFLLYKAISGENAIPVGTGYAVWGGIGAVFTVLAGIVFLGESISFWRLFFLCSLVISLVGLNLISK